MGPKPLSPGPLARGICTHRRFAWTPCRECEQEKHAAEVAKLKSALSEANLEAAELRTALSEANLEAAELRTALADLLDSVAEIVEFNDFIQQQKED